MVISTPIRRMLARPVRRNGQANGRAVPDGLLTMAPPVNVPAWVTVYRYSPTPAPSTMTGSAARSQRQEARQRPRSAHRCWSGAGGRQASLRHTLVFLGRRFMVPISRGRENSRPQGATYDTPSTPAAQRSFGEAHLTKDTTSDLNPFLLQRRCACEPYRDLLDAQRRCVPNACRGWEAGGGREAREGASSQRLRQSEPHPQRGGSAQ